MLDEKDVRVSNKSCIQNNFKVSTFNKSFICVLFYLDIIDLF